RYREINVALTTPAAGGWSAVLEYPTDVDVHGVPTAWGTLTLLADTTGGFRTSGRITFDPPANWKSAILGASARLFYIRVRTLTDGTAPVARALLGRDYVGANGSTTGIIPAFDYAADANHDSYLTDAEYAPRQPGDDARFAYEGRAFYGSYGQMRFATNPASASFRAWVVDYSGRVLVSQPLASGLFVDNSTGVVGVNPAAVLEPTAS